VAVTNHSSIVPVRPAEMGLDWYTIAASSGQQSDVRYQELELHMASIHCHIAVELSSFFPDDRRKHSKFALDMWFSKISVSMFIKDHGNKKSYFVWRILYVIAEQDEAKCVQCAAYVARKCLATYDTR
jgi:hypothetical protein